MNRRESQILCGLLLSKYNEQGAQALGFKTFAEAYNVLGSALGVPPSTIKNYRDEIDPYFPNGRLGWHQRPLRKHCSEILDKFGDASLDDLSKLIKTFFDPNWDLVDEQLAIESPTISTEESPFAKRLITGRAAEGFFRLHYNAHEVFAGGTLIDSTTFGCGFDFRVNFTDPNAFYAVEVKGMIKENGSILLTEKEYRLAAHLKDRFFLYLVRNFRESPYASIWRNPLNSQLDWKLREEQITINTWRTSV